MNWLMHVVVGEHERQQVANSLNLAGALCTIEQHTHGLLCPVFGFGKHLPTCSAG